MTNKYSINKLLRVFTVGGGVFVQSIIMTPVEAEIFKCTNKTGDVYYNDKPCPIKDDEKKIRNEKDVLNGYTPSARDERNTSTEKNINQTNVNSPISGKTPKQKNTDKQHKRKKKSSQKGGGSSEGSTSAEDNDDNDNVNVKAMKIRLEALVAEDKKNTTNKLTMKQKRLLLDVQIEPE